MCLPRFQSSPSVESCALLVFERSSASARLAPSKSPALMRFCTVSACVRASSRAREAVQACQAKIPTMKNPIRLSATTT